MTERFIWWSENPQIITKDKIQLWDNYQIILVKGVKYRLSWTNYWYITWEWENTYISVCWLWEKKSDRWFWQIHLYKWWTLVVPYWEWLLEISRKWLKQWKSTIKSIKNCVNGIIWMNSVSESFTTPDQLIFKLKLINTTFEEIIIPMEYYK